MPTRKYITDLRYDDQDESTMVCAIQSVFPALPIRAVETHFADPLIPPGRVRATIDNVTPDLHGEIMQVPGVSLAD
jgi:hypothetical protein